MASASRKEKPKAGPKPEEAVGITAGIAPGEREKLVEKHGRIVGAGETIYSEGDAASEAFVLQEGRVRLTKRARSGERRVVLPAIGDLFGESALKDAAPRTSTAVALTDCLVLAFTRETFRALLESHPAVAMRVVEQLTSRIRDGEDQIEIRMLGDAHSRVVSALVALARDASGGAAVTGAVPIAATPVELSARTGLDVDAVRHAVQRLREQGYVKIEAEKLELPDLGALKALFALLGTREALAIPGR
jgi:CRP-like cAMP-binding protein